MGLEAFLLSDIFLVWKKKEKEKEKHSLVVAGTGKKPNCLFFNFHGLQTGFVSLACSA